MDRFAYRAVLAVHERSVPRGRTVRRTPQPSAVSQCDRRWRLPCDRGGRLHLQHAHPFIAVRHRRDRLRGLRYRNRDVDSRGRQCGHAGRPARPVRHRVGGIQRVPPGGHLRRSRDPRCRRDRRRDVRVGESRRSSPRCCRQAAIGQAHNVASARIGSATRALGAGARAAAEQAFSHGYAVAVLVAGFFLVAAAVLAVFGLRHDRTPELDAVRSLSTGGLGSLASTRLGASPNKWSSGPGLNDQIRKGLSCRRNR
jgi:hypothetical protein